MNEDGNSSGLSDSTSGSPRLGSAYGLCIWVSGAGLLTLVTGMSAYAALSDEIGWALLFAAFGACAVWLTPPVWRWASVVAVEPYLLAVILLIALAARVTGVAVLPYKPGLDSELYHESGLKMAHTWRLEVKADKNNAGYRSFFPPGQIFSLALLYRLLGPYVVAGQSLNVFYGVMTVLGVWYLAKQIFGVVPAYTAALVYAVMPSSILGCVCIGAEVPATFWMTAGLCAYVVGHRKRNAWKCFLVSGLLFGVATLIRPTILLVPLVLLMHQLFANQISSRTRSALVLVVGTALVVLPWTWRNYHVTGGFVLISSNAGGNLYSANNDRARGAYTPSAWQELFAKGPDDLRLNRLGFAKAKRWIRENPIRFGQLAVRKFSLFWQRDKDMAFWAMAPSANQSGLMTVSPEGLWAVEAASSGFYSMCLAAGALGLWRWRREFACSLRWCPVVPLLFCFTVVHVVFEAQGKYHFLLVPLLCVLAGLASASKAEDGPL